MILRSTILAFCLATAAFVAAPEHAAAQTEGELANPRSGVTAPPGWWRGGGGTWRGDGYRDSTPRWDPGPGYGRPPPRWDRDQGYDRPPPSYGGGCRIVYRDDGWGGQAAFRECRVCEPVWVRDSWGNSHRENRCRRVVQRVG